MTSENIVEIYADGASRGNPGPAGAGAILRSGPWVKYMSRYLGETTNNVAELTAVLMALESIRDRNRRVVVYVDSKYVWGILTQNWKAKKNRDLVQKLREVFASFPHISVQYVPGHAGIAGNETADRLAVMAAKSGKSMEKIEKLDESGE